MFWLKSRNSPKSKNNNNSAKRNLDDEIRQLVKFGKNNKIKSLILASNPADLIDCTGTTICHLAAKYSNISLIEFLLDSGYDINVRNGYGTTPLLMAILHRNYGVVKFLLDANANIFACNAIGQTPLQLLVDKTNDVPSSVMKHLVKRLKVNRVNADKLAKVLLEADCSLEFALLLEKAEVTRLMLSGSQEISIERAYDLLIQAMDSNYLENIKVLLHNGDKARFRREKFLENLADRIRGSPENMESARPFLQKLADWDVIDEAFVQTLKTMFSSSDKPVLELLLDCEIDQLVRRKFRRELVVHVFANRGEGVMELLLERQFNVNARDKDGETGLHVTARYSFPERIEFLLSRGANPNVKDKRGRNSLHYAWDVDCIEPLVRGGANLQILDYNGFSVFDRSQTLTDAMEVLFAGLAISEARGVAIKRKIGDLIESRDEFREFYDKCRRQIGWMREQVVRDGIMALDVLMGRFEGKLDAEVCNEVMSGVRDFELHRFYVETLQRNLAEGMQMNQRGG